MTIDRYYETQQKLQHVTLRYVQRELLEITVQLVVHFNIQ